ncbi:MAG: zinc ribbon domain-containing protein [Tannerella sp.]|jgi:hypothetical protein|nr:zinc ribbon domain-containing protein [Tannerella sp.]
MGTKNCPFCGEEILATARKCKHCGEWLEEQTETEIEAPESTLITNFNSTWLVRACWAAMIFTIVIGLKRQLKGHEYASVILPAYSRIMFVAAIGSGQYLGVKLHGGR